jgi:hypothetical protein
VGAGGASPRLRGIGGVLCVAAVSLGLAAFFVPSAALAQGMAIPGTASVSDRGAARYTIPIALPPGTAGIAPALALSYNSQAGNGLLGMGWQLEGLSSVTRCPRTVATDGVHGGVLFDANDRFCLDGQRLIAISGTYGADGAEYRTEIESFAKVISRGAAGTGPAWFEVWTKSGQRLELGNSTDSRHLVFGGATARSWAVNKVADTKGNFFTVTYVNDTAGGQAYPSRIDYTGNAAAGLAPYNSVRFVYQTRPDRVPAWLGGGSMGTTVRLANLQLYAGANLVTDYRLSYAQGASTKRSQLTSLTLCGANASCLPVTSFAWQQGNENGSSAVSFTEYLSNFVELRRPALEISYSDINGDGLTDVTAHGAGSQYTDIYFSNGIRNGTLEFTRVNTPNLRFFELKNDFNGDGLPDALIRADASLYWHINNGVSGGAVGFREYPSNFVELRRPALEISYSDINGDGLTDVIAHGAGSQYTDIYFSNGIRNGTLEFTRVNTPNLRFFELKNDFNGDGLPDALIRADASLYWHLNNNTSPDLLISVRSGLGAAVGFTHQPLTAPGVYSKDTGGNAAVAPVRDVVGPLWVVTRLDQSDGIGGVRSWGYAYAGAKTHGHGRGFLGFRQTKVTDLQKSIVTTTTYRQDFPFEGLIANETTTAGQLTLKAVTNSYGSAALGGTRQRVFLSGSTVQRTDLNGAALPSVATAYQYDGFNNATEVTITTSDGFSKTVTNSYQNDTGNWLLGRLLTGAATNQTPQ